MLQWFVKEQVEEEASASDILARTKIQGNNSGQLLTLDHEMGRRE
jgi:ferritin